MPVLRVSYAFASLPQEEIDNFTKGVSDNLYIEPVYTAAPGPPVTKAALDASNASLTAAIAKAKAGGPARTQRRRIWFCNLTSACSASWPLLCRPNMATISRSCSVPGSRPRTDRTAVVLTKPEGVTVTNGTSGQLVVKVTKVKGCNMYEARATPEGGAPLPSVFTGDSQHIYLNNLTPGVMYKVEVRCLGGADPGYTDWSDPTSHRAL